MHDQLDSREAEAEARGPEPDQVDPVAEPEEQPAEEAPTETETKDSDDEGLKSVSDSIAITELIKRVQEALDTEPDQGNQATVLDHLFVKTLCGYAGGVNEALHLRDRAIHVLKRGFREELESDAFAERTGERAVYVRDDSSADIVVRSFRVTSEAA
jgi:hypothetical protein